MTLNASGPISLGGATTGQSINLELGKSATALASINATDFRTLAGVASGQISLSNFYGKSNILTGQTEYTNQGTYTWVCPSGVTKVSVLCIGKGGNGATQGTDFCGCIGTINYGGGGGGGGGLAYLNNYAVTPGTSYTVVVSGSPTSRSYFHSTSTVSVVHGGNGVGRSAGSAGFGTSTSGGTGSGGSGGNGTYNTDPANTQLGGGGGGAAGYSGTGGQGSSAYGPPDPGGNAATNSGGAGGGTSGGISNGGAGGGTGSLGKGSTGLGATTNGGRGGAGSGGVGGGVTTAGGTYGGGGGGGAGYVGAPGGAGGGAIVRIIYPGDTRFYPSTNTGNL